MPWVRFVEIDGFRVVHGFDAPSIDPVATARVIDPMMAETDEYKHAESIRREFGDLERRRQALLGTARRARNHAELTATQNSYVGVVRSQNALQQKAAAHKIKYMAKRAELMAAHAVRFEIGNCLEITQKQKDKLTDAFALLQPRQLLTLDGHVITDHRGLEYWFQVEGEWMKTVIKGLDEELPPGAKLRTELTDDECDEIRQQAEIERISKLNDGQREKEKQDRVKEALAVAARVRSQYEIEGRADPLGDSKQWFKAEVKRLENLYR